MHALSSLYPQDNLPDEIIESGITIRTWARNDAKILPGNYPLVIFGHGFGMNPTHYTSLCEEIASHGYVEGIQHNFFSDCFELEYIMRVILNKTADFGVGNLSNDKMSYIKDNIINFFNQHFHKASHQSSASLNQS